MGPEDCTLAELTTDSANSSDYLDYSVMADLSDLTDPLDSELHDPLIEASTIYQNMRNDPLREGPVDLKSILKTNRLNDPRVDQFCQTCATSPKLADKLWVERQKIWPSCSTPTSFPSIPFTGSTSFVPFVCLFLVP